MAIRVNIGKKKFKKSVPFMASWIQMDLTSFK